jgi:hypothetical protein
MFEVIPVNANDLADIELTKTRSTGIFTTDDLVRISHRFGADGALHGVVSHGAAAPTLRIGVRASLIDCRSGQVAWASDVSLDTGSRRVASDARAYHNTVLSHSDSLLSADRMLVQPGLFLTYVAHRMAETLAASRAPNNP